MDSSPLTPPAAGNVSRVTCQDPNTMTSRRDMSLALEDSLLSSDVCMLPLPVEASSPSPPRGARANGSSNSKAKQRATGAPQRSLIGDASDGFPRAAATPMRFPKHPPTASTTSTASSQKQQHHHQQTVLIVVNVLPLVFERNATDSGWNVEWSSSSTSLFYRNLVSDTDRYRPLFIGCPEVFVSRDEETTIEAQLRAFHCVPVFLDPQVAHRYFQGFCKGVLWPIFHNVVDVYNSAKLVLDEHSSDRNHACIGPNNCTPVAPSPAVAAAHDDTAPPLSPSSPGAASKPAWCDPASWNPAAQDACWGDYCSVNRTFARRIIESYHDGYMIWIHDFNFLMLPSYVLRKLRSAMIAIYLHVPFPSSEIFRCLAMRTEIIRAMLCADHIGFLIFEHARHFLTSCKRLLGLNYKTSPNGMLVLEYNGRKVNISCSHIEPDVRYLHSILDQHHTDRHDSAHQFRKRIERFVCDATTKTRKFVIASVDRLEGLSALPLKLRAFDRFLALHPSKRGSVILVQIGISLDSRPNDYHQTREYVQKFVKEINRRWSSGPAESDQVVYFEERHKTTCAERMHLWRMSDVYFDTCVRYGLSLLPFEYLVAQKRNLEQAVETNDGTHQFGAMIVSEFASYSRILNGCLLVNPWKTDDIVSALVKATEMQYYEKLNRFQLNYKFLVEHSETRWAERLLADFEALMEKKQQAAESNDTVAIGFGFDYRVMQFASGFVKLDLDELVRVTSRCSRRLFVFDYGGTLSWTTSLLEEDGAAHHHFQNQNHQGGFGSGSFMETPPTGNGSGGFGQEAIRSIDGQVRTSLSREARENLKTLCGDPQNIVFVISTGRKVELDAEFGSIPHLNLVSDNGLFLKKATSATWECIYNPEDLRMDWKDEVQRIMQSYASRTNGTILVAGEASLLYDYRNSDPEYGEIQALELYEQLRQVIKKGDATIHRAKGFVEVQQFGVSKPIALSLILHHLKEHVGVPDIALYAGDDESDELAFKALQAFADTEPTLAHVYTCTVGMKPSRAKYYVDSVSDVLAMIHAISVRLRLGGNRSMTASAIFQKGFADRFMAHSASLVDASFLHSLAVETLGPELSSDLLATSKTSNSPRGSLDPDCSLLLMPLQRAPLSNWISNEWLAFGAGVALGVLGSVAIAAHGARPSVHNRDNVKSFGWLRSQLQRLSYGS